MTTLHTVNILEQLRAIELKARDHAHATGHPAGVRLHQSRAEALGEAIAAVNLKGKQIEAGKHDPLPNQQRGALPASSWDDYVDELRKNGPHEDPDGL